MLDDARIPRDLFRRLDLRSVALTVAERERVHGEALVLRDCEHGGRIESAAEEEDGGPSSGRGGGGRFQRRASEVKSKARLVLERLRQCVAITQLQPVRRVGDAISSSRD